MTTTQPSTPGLASPDPPGSPAREPWGWTRRQRLGLGILLTALLTFLVIQYLRRPGTLDDPVIADPAAELPRHIDPNTATVQQLARIPHLGEALARRIVEYRDTRVPNSADGIVFRQATDLDAVPGIGPRLVEQFAPYFQFPEPATRP